MPLFDTARANTKNDSRTRRGDGVDPKQPSTLGHTLVVGHHCLEFVADLHRRSQMQSVRFGLCSLRYDEELLSAVPLTCNDGVVTVESKGLMLHDAVLNKSS